MDDYQNKRLNGRPIIEGELVTPPPANYAQQKALPNQTYIDSTTVKKPLSSPQITPQAITPTNNTLSLTQKPQLSSAAPQAINPEMQPAQLSKMSNAVGKLSSAMPAIQAGMNASAIMNQEADFANKIHAGSIADPNFGNEVMGTAPQKTFSRTFTPQKDTRTSGVIGVGRGAIEPIPDKTINTRAGVVTNPDYAEYTKRHPSAVAPVQSVQSTSPSSPSAVTSPTSEKPKLSDGQMAINDYKSGKSGTGWVKMGDREAYIQADNKGKVALYNQDGSLQKNIDGHGINYQSATGRGSIQSNAVPTLAGVRGLEDARNEQISSANNKAFMNDLNAQVQRGEITSNQARQQFESRQISQMPMNERSDAIGQASLQSAAWQGDTKAAAELANLNRQKQAADHALNNPVQKLAEHKASLEQMVASSDPKIAEQGRQGLAQLDALAKPVLIAKKRKEEDAVGNSIESTELVNPYTGLAPNNQVANTNFKEGDRVVSPDGKKGRIVRGQFVEESNS